MQGMESCPAPIYQLEANLQLIRDVYMSKLKADIQTASNSSPPYSANCVTTNSPYLPTQTVL